MPLLKPWAVETSPPRADFGNAGTFQQDVLALGGADPPRL